MSFILHSRLKAFWIIVAIILLVELIVRIVPMYKAAKTGVYLANHRSRLLSRSEPEYDFILFGESRSLSILGHKRTLEQPYSLYNFSVPAMGSNYYAYYFQKYMRHRKAAPKAIIFSGDPSVFQSGWNKPLHDPDEIYSDSRTDSLALYFKNRFFRRIQIAMGTRDIKNENQKTQELYWKTYSHRYLHLFSFSESASQYTGAERIFMLYEHSPLLYETFKWREVIAHYFFGVRASYFKTIKLPEHCRKSCKATWDSSCYPDIQRLQQNAMLNDYMHQSYGQINLADLKGPSERLKFMAIRSQAFDTHIAGLQTAIPDLAPLENLAREAKKYGSHVILSFAPTLKRYSQTEYYRKFQQELSGLLKKHDNILVVEFGRKFISEDLFVDNAHYTCEGANIVNIDFYQSVMPKILKFYARKMDILAQ